MFLVQKLLLPVLFLQICNTIMLNISSIAELEPLRSYIEPSNMDDIMKNFQANNETINLDELKNYFRENYVKNEKQVKFLKPLLPTVSNGKKPVKKIPPEYIPFGNSYYKYHRDPIKWAEARKICESEGGYLTIINSQAEADFINEMMNKHPAITLLNVVFKNYVLIGFHDCFSEGDYVTIDGKSLSNSGYLHWQPILGGDNAFNEDCGSFYRYGGLNDFPCIVPSPFICEISSDCNNMVSIPQNVVSNQNWMTWLRGLCGF